MSPSVAVLFLRRRYVFLLRLLYHEKEGQAGVILALRDVIFVEKCVVQVRSVFRKSGNLLLSLIMLYFLKYWRSWAHDGIESKRV